MVEFQLSLDLCRPTLKISYILITILIAINFLLPKKITKKNSIYLSFIIRAVEG